MTPTHEQVAWTGEVFGPRGVRLLSRVELLNPDSKDWAHTLWAGHARPNACQVVLPRSHVDNPLIFVHELAHAYHSLEFPHMTLCTTVARAEACAFLAEDSLARHLDGRYIVELRTSYWAHLATGEDEDLRAAVQLALYAMKEGERNRELSIHDLFEMILGGLFEI